MTQERKEILYKEVCKELLLKRVSTGAPLPDKYDLNLLAQDEYNRKYRLHSVNEYLQKTKSSNDLAATLIANHEEEAFRLADALAPKENFYLSTGEEVLNDFKETLSKYHVEAK